VPHGFGAFGRILPQAVNPASVVSLGSTSNSTGVGLVTREETINLNVAAIITQVLPNGNLVIYGRQEVRVNFGVRELKVTGVIRPEDISSSNTIRSPRHASFTVAALRPAGARHLPTLLAELAKDPAPEKGGQSSR
jgi:flagellar L-ring protein precursor FlgH